MANPEHLSKLSEGVKHWNLWRKENPNLRPDLSKVNLNHAILREINFNDTDLSKVFFIDADLMNAYLDRANLSGANIHSANFTSVDLNEADLSNADLSCAEFFGAFLIRANLNKANLSNANLNKAALIQANLSEANLNEANLSEADLSKANLSNASLSRTQSLASNFTKSVFNGACIEDWNINSDTKLHDVTCDYVYLKAWQQERRPSNLSKYFLPGEFNALIQQSLHTVDLIFVDGIDWHAFFLSFQELRSQFDGRISIQAIEKKSGAFVIRLEVPPEADKAAIESRAKELYERDRLLLETQYQALLQVKEGQIAVYQEWLKAERQDNTDLTGIVKTMAEKDTSKVTQNFNAPVTGIAGNVEGSQYINNLQSANIANFANQLRESASQNASQFSQTIGQNADDIARLLIDLREQAQQFPDGQRDDALIGLDDLQQDLSTPAKREPNRIKRRIVALLMIAGAIATPIATATDFANNVFELADKVGIPPSELIQHVPTHLLPPQSQP